MRFLSVASQHTDLGVDRRSTAAALFAGMSSAAPLRKVWLVLKDETHVWSTPYMVSFFDPRMVYHTWVFLIEILSRRA